MPPRTGPRRKRRTKASAPAALRHFVLVFDDGINDLVIAHRLELSEGYLMLHDANDDVFRIVARGEWREIRPATIGDIPYADEADNPAVNSGTDQIDSMSREEATLTPPEDPQRFVPSSPEEAQRILSDPHAPPPTPRKD